MPVPFIDTNEMDWVPLAHVVRHTDAQTARAEYLAWCRSTGRDSHRALR